MLGRYSPVRFGAGVAAIAACALLAVAAPAGAAGPKAGTFQKRASSPKPVNNVVVDPTTNLIYAQQYEGKGFYRYNPRTNSYATYGQDSTGFTRYVTAP